MRLESSYFLSGKAHEECGVFALYNHPQAAKYGFYGLHALQHRGQEGAGIATSDFHKIKIDKGHGLLSDLFDEAALDALGGSCMLSHVRYATSGGKEIENVQPIMVRSSVGDFALAHNGNIVNALELRQQLEKEGSIFQGSSDTEVVAHLIQRAQGSFMEKIKCALNQLEGAFAIVIMTKNTMYAMRDKNGLRPLSIARLDQGYCISSETCSFDIVGATWFMDLQPGEIVRIAQEGILHDFYTTHTQKRLCAMEYIYFSRPDSNLDGLNVHKARKACGAALAQADTRIEDAIVVGVPDSSLSAAMGYAMHLNLPYEMGLIKNRYVARTFIQPTQEMRDKGVRMKLSAVKGIVENKEVILIDDSIVRGTTSKRIVRLLKEAGAKAVHVRIASPKISMPCFYGVDTSSKEELIGAFASVDEIQAFIEADSLQFMSLDLLKQALGHDQLCTSCFGTSYPTQLYSYGVNLEGEEDE
ncbi:MAG: amidophosphoribosyltransferase [Erysipelotrichaceae bacterium]